MRICIFYNLVSTFISLTDLVSATHRSLGTDKLLLRRDDQTRLSARHTSPKSTFYYEVDAATHQSKFNTLSSRGYRIISLSISGSSTSPKYAAVWVRRSGPAFVAVHNVNVTAYQLFFDKYTAQGYVSTIISATGPQESAVFAGIMEKIPVDPWQQVCGMTQNQTKTTMSKSFRNRLVLKSFSEYGTPFDRRYCAIWHANPVYEKSDWWLSDTAAIYQSKFDIEVTKPYWRPAYLSISEDQQYMSLFTDTSVGSWSARHDITGAELLKESEAQQAAGKYLIHLTAGGTGANTRYAAIFAMQDIPSSRSWRVAGESPTGFKNNSAVTNQTSSLLKSWMQLGGVR